MVLREKCPLAVLLPKGILLIFRGRQTSVFFKDTAEIILVTVATAPGNFSDRLAAVF